MSKISPVDNDLTDLIKTDTYRSVIGAISDKYSTMDKFINNLNSDISEISNLVQKLVRDQKRGYDVGTSLDTLGFQKDTLTLDRDFFASQKATYLKKIYQDLFKYTNGIIEKAIEIEDNPLSEEEEDIKRKKFGNVKMFNPDDENMTYNMSDVYDLLSVTERNLFELASDIATFKDLIADAESKESRGFAVGNMILNLKEQQSSLKLSFASYCTRLEQFLNENRKFAGKCVKRIEMISGEIVTEEEQQAIAAETNVDNTV